MGIRLFIVGAADRIHNFLYAMQINILCEFGDVFEMARREYFFSIFVGNLYCII